MDAEPLGPGAHRPDPHDWNSLENFIHIHETRLEDHPFVDHDRPHTLRLEQYEDGEETLYRLDGEVYCRYNVIVEVTKLYNTRTVAGRLQVRGFSYRYNARIRGRHTILRYDNWHTGAPEEFHRHEYAVADGTEIQTRIISRYELPTFADILTEIQGLMEST